MIKNSLSMKIAIGNDHAGTLLKIAVRKWLEEQGHVVEDFDTNDEIPVDYPDCVHPVVEIVIKSEARFGILICGSAQGVSMTANKYKKIRAAVCWEPEIATLARKHNDANILCLPARCVSEKTACNITFNFLQTAFEGGRHKRRIEKITIGLQEF
jgi:ribose 5-phosphate isomerase B